MSVSFEDRDNFIRNAVTVLGPRVGLGVETSLREVSTGDLPIDIDDLLYDLRVDDPDDDRETVTRLAKGACSFIARRTGYVLLPTVFEVITPSWWNGPMEISRGPLRSLESFQFQSARDVWDPVDPEQAWATGRDRTISVRLLDGFTRPELWQQSDCIRLQFSAGFDAADESGGDLPLPDGLRTVLTMVTGHYYQNRDMLGLASPRTGLQAVELGAESLLGMYRQFW